MDVVLQYTDKYLFTPYVYPESWDEGNPVRQCISLFLITWLMGYISYLLVAIPSYFFIFDHDMMKHPQFQKNQLREEFFQSSYAMPIMFMMSTPMFYLEITGRTRLTDSYNNSYFGYFSIIPELIGMILVVDLLSYTFHRAMHHKLIYKYLHKEHHKWKVATPFASHAFHPVDGFLQQMPYHVCVVLFPVNKYIFVAFLCIANIWAVTIHDGEFEMSDWMKSVINGPAHHTDHHMYFKYNYGQFFTVWDRIAGTYRHPSTFEGEGPLDYVRREACDTPATASKTDATLCEMDMADEVDSGVESADDDFEENVFSLTSDQVNDAEDLKIAPFSICDNCSNIDELNKNNLMYNERNDISLSENTEEVKNSVPEKNAILSSIIDRHLGNERTSLELFDRSNFDSTETLIRRRFSVNLENTSVNEFAQKRRRFSFRG